MSHDRSGVALVVVLGALAFGSTGASKGCANAEDSSDVSQDEIVTQHWVVFDEKADKTTARATFRFGHELGTVLQLQPPAQVTFATSAPLAFDPNWGWHFVDLPGLVDAGTFVYRDTRGTERQTTTPAFARTELPPVGTIARAAASSLAWQGAPLGDGEEVEIYVASAANRLNVVRFATNAVGAAALVLTPDVLAQLPPGGVVLGLNRHRTVRPDARTKITATWAARDVSATLQ